MNKINLGISSCLLGNQVRYDGRHKLNQYVTTVFSPYFNLLPVCPEVESGFGIPREPLILEGDIDNPSLITEITRQDFTQLMLSRSTSRCDQLATSELRGFIFKTKSPSCGLSDVAVFNQAGDSRLEGRGLFANTFIKRFPILPVIDEISIEDENARDAFIEHVFVINRWLAENSSASSSGLKRLHATHSYLLMSHDIEHYQQCCRLIALIDSHPFDRIADKYLETLLKTLSINKTVKKTKEVLVDILNCFNGLLSGRQNDELGALIVQYSQRKIPVEIPLNKLSQYTNQFKIQDLQDQVFLNPDPAEILLRKSAKSIK